MGEIKFIVYINGQSSKPLVHSISQAMAYASRNLRYKPSLRIECYCALFKISEWVYDYHDEQWQERIVSSSRSLYQKME
jgi:hypothetical protein